MKKVILGVLLLALPVAASGATLRVPSQFATIQAAVEAARPGDRIQIRAGTYVEQLSIGKDLDVTGAGPFATILRAPAKLVPGPLGTSSIVEIHSGAEVRMSGLTVSGPGAQACEDQPLRAGISAYEEAHLELRFVRVTRIHNTPLAPCPRSGVGIVIGDPFVSTAMADIRLSEVSHYQNIGILVLNEGSHATVSHNLVRGVGPSDAVTTRGIEFVLGAQGTIASNVVSGNFCTSPELGCGPDLFAEIQSVGIGGDGPGVVIRRNLLFGNQVGIYVGGAADIRDNVLIGNAFGMALQDGTFRVTGDLVMGGLGGVAAIAAFADTEAVLDGVTILGTSEPPTQELECCGFTARIVRGAVRRAR